MNESPKIPEENGDIAMDPREKKGAGLDFWAEALLKSGQISYATFDNFNKQNNSKEQSMREKGFPQLKHFGVFGSIQEIRDMFPDCENKWFIIRCKSKETGEVVRKLDVDLNGVCDYANQLAGGFEKWNVEVKEFVHETIAAGTIVVSPSGHTSIETWHGAHYLNVDQNTPKYHAEFDPGKFDIHYNWKAPEGATDLSEMQNYSIKALRYIFSDLKPRPNEPIYIEFGVKDGGEIYFIEANDSPILTGRE